MNYSVIRKNARESLANKWGIAVLCFIVYGLISTAVEGAFWFSEALALLGSIAFMFIVGPLEYGFNNTLVRIKQGKQAEISDLFKGFNDFSRTMAVGISIYIRTFLWSLLFIIPGIVASYSYSMAYFIMIDDPKISPDEAIKKSKSIMEGNKWKLFCLDFSFIGWMIACVFTLGIGMLWLVPYMRMARVHFYEEITGSILKEADSTVDETERETVVKKEDEIDPYTPSSSTELYNLRCDKCGASETDNVKQKECNYCGGIMQEEKK